MLIFSPVAKPCEPPAGIATLSGALAAHNVKHILLDANLEGIFSLLAKPMVPADTWSRRAHRHLSQNLSSLKSWKTYTNIDTYKRAVLEINRLLGMSGGERVRISLADYHDRYLSPVQSTDLLFAAHNPEENPFYEYFSSRLPPLIERSSTTVAGFSLNYLSQALTTFAMIGFLKQEFPRVRIVLGGGLVTSWMTGGGSFASGLPGEGLFKGLVDHCVSGPGEYQLLALLHKKPPHTTHVTPRYDPLPVGDYLAPGLILPYRSSTGCYWSRCSFCPERAEETQYCQRPPDAAALELRNLVSSRRWLFSHMKPALIHLVDNAISPAFMEAIVKQPPGAPWYGFARITPHLKDPDFCISLKQSGCVLLKLGLESGDQDVLDAMHKGIDLSTASLALQNLRKAGISTYVYLLFGTPAETRAAAQHTLDFVVNHAEEIQFVNAAIFNLPLKSPEAATLETASFYEGDLSLYAAFHHPKGWSRRLVRRFLDREFRRHPAIRSIVGNHPPIFTSNHAPFFACRGTSPA